MCTHTGGHTNTQLSAVAKKKKTPENFIFIYIHKLQVLPKFHPDKWNASQREHPIYFTDHQYYLLNSESNTNSEHKHKTILNIKEISWLKFTCFNLLLIGKVLICFLVTRN